MLIRDATVDDVPAIYEMLAASAADQGFPGELVVTSDDLLEDGFGPTPRFQCLIAEVEGRPAGLALYYFNYSTWVSRNGLYLEDLYVAPEWRGHGVARELMVRLTKIGREAGCRRFLWVVHAVNERAICF